jgi:GAF domain-containing protein
MGRSMRPRHRQQRLHQYADWGAGSNGAARYHVARVRALVEISTAFSIGGGAMQSVLHVLAHGLARSVGGGCLIRPLPGASTAVPVTFDHARATARAHLRNLLRIEPRAFLYAYSAGVAHTGQTIFTPVVSSGPLRLWSEPPAWSYLEQFEVCSVLAVPLRAHGAVLGNMIVWREQPSRPFVEADCFFAEQVARRLAVALPGTQPGPTTAPQPEHDRTRE